MRDEKQWNLLAAALNNVWRIRIGVNRDSGESYPTPQQALSLLEQEPAIRESLQHGYALNSTLRFPGGMAVALHYLFAMVEAEDADDFFNRLVVGAELEEDHPVFVLRKILEKDALAVRRKRQMELAAVTIKAWNAYRGGEHIQRLYWSPGGARPEKFPEIR